MKKTIILILSALIVIFLTLAIIRFLNQQRELFNLEIAEIDFSEVADGIYQGEYEVFPVSVVVNIAVFNGEITEINILEHQHGRGEAAEVIVDDIIEAQSLQVDTISGATSSSKVILKAIESAILDLD